VVLVLVKEVALTHELELELELIQTRMIQKPLLWIGVGKSTCLLVGVCGLYLSLPARYDLGLYLRRYMEWGLCVYRPDRAPLKGAGTSKHRI
jgi:hypothetical protein